MNLLSLTGSNYGDELKMEQKTAHAVKKLYSFDVYSFPLIIDIMAVTPKEVDWVENCRSGLKFYFLRILHMCGFEY